VLVTLAAVSCASGPKRDPDQSFVRYQLGVEYFKANRMEAATEELQKALAADPQNQDALHMLGIIALRQGYDYIQQGETASCLTGRDAEVVRQDAQRKFKEAEQYFKKAVALQPEFPMAWNNLSVAALQLGDWPAAASAAEQAIKDSTYTEPEVARANLGWAHLQMKDTQRAWKELHEAVSRSPKFCVGRYRLAKVYFERGDLEQAQENIDVVVTDARCPIQEAYLLAGLIHQRRRNRDRARALFQRCADMAPRSCTAGECRRYASLIR
jgi:type IV pilus assembly protein PilF